MSFKKPTLIVPVGATEAYRVVPQLKNYKIISKPTCPCNKCLNCRLKNALPTGQALDAVSSFEAACDDCGFFKSAVSAKAGYILNPEKIQVSDALEILKRIVGMGSLMDECVYALDASLITEKSRAENEPSVSDALEILKKLVGIPNRIDNPR